MAPSDQSTLEHYKQQAIEDFSRAVSPPASLVGALVLADVGLPTWKRVQNSAVTSKAKE